MSAPGLVAEWAGAWVPGSAGAWVPGSAGASQPGWTVAPLEWRRELMPALESPVALKWPREREKLLAQERMSLREWLLPQRERWRLQPQSDWESEPRPARTSREKLPCRLGQSPTLSAPRWTRPR